MSVVGEAERVLGKLGNRWPRRTVWKVLFVLGLIVLGLIFLVGISVWFLGKLVGSITAGGFRNRDLYLPRMSRRR